MIEYRTASGERIELAASGQLVSTRQKVNLRSLGCPDWLATRIEDTRRNRHNVAQHSECDATLTISEMKARAAKIADAIAADAKHFEQDEELRRRMRQQAAMFLHGG